MSHSSDLIMGAQTFENVAMRAFLQELIGNLRGKPAQLLSFEDVRARLRLREESYGGLQEIPLDSIVGSVGRYKDFTSSFLPKSAVNKERWSRIYAEFLGNMGLPPIEVYQLGEVYFVRDGNHRVSVARALGNETIEAYVTAVDSPVCLTRLMLTNQIDKAEAYMTFLEESGLRYVPQHENLMLSEPSRYGDLMGHLNLHRSVLSEAQHRDVSLEEAANHWHQTVYLPAVASIRRYDLLEHAKGRTEADMYLWLIEHLGELELCYTGLLSDVTPALASFLRKRRLPVPDELLREVV